MTLVDISAAAFAASHIARFVAYWPQVIVLIRVEGDARAVSVLSWALFGVSHAATALYGWLALRDLGVFLAFGLNTVCCGLIIGLTVYKRWRWAPGRQGQNSSMSLERSRSPSTSPEPTRAS